MVMNMVNEMTIQLRQISASTSEATIGRHRVLIDRPAAKGGADAGPMGGELFLAAVTGFAGATALEQKSKSGGLLLISRWSGLISSLRLC
jgi:hypothetical protein